MSFPKLIRHIIIEDTNGKKCATVRAKALSKKKNMVQVKPTPNITSHVESRAIMNHIVGVEKEITVLIGKI